MPVFNGNCIKFYVFFAGCINQTNCGVEAGLFTNNLTDGCFKTCDY